MGCQQSSTIRTAKKPVILSSGSKVFPLFDSIVPGTNPNSPGVLSNGNNTPRSFNNVQTSLSFPELRTPNNGQRSAGAEKRGSIEDPRRSSKGGKFQFIERQSQYRVRTAIKRVQVPNVAVHLDSKTAKIHVLDLDILEWTSRKLNEATIYASAQIDSLESKDIMTITTLIEEIDKLSFLATETTKIHFIGNMHLCYDLNDNTFEVLPLIQEKRETPVLCLVGGNIYSLSGVDESNQYSRRCECYDLVKNQWTRLEDLPNPHIKGAALAYQATFADSERLKLVVVGGYKAIEVSKPLTTASVYDCKQDFWRVVDLQFRNFQTPALTNVQMILTSSDELYVFGKENETVKYYRFEPEDNTVITISTLNASGDLVSLGLQPKSENVQLVTVLPGINQETLSEVWETALPFEAWKKRTIQIE